MIDTSKKVLAVDGFSTMLRIVRSLLNQIGFNDIDEASDGKAALDLFEQNEYGLVISEWNMEPMSGYEFLKRVRAGDRNHDVPFIMVTSESKAENVLKAKQAGVSNYIVKPFNAETLKTKIEMSLKD